MFGALVVFGIYCVISYFLQENRHVLPTDVHAQTERNEYTDGATQTEEPAVQSNDVHAQTECNEYTDGATQTEEPMSDEKEEQSLTRNNTESMPGMKVNDSGLPNHAFNSINLVPHRELQRSNSVNFPIVESQYSQLAELYNKFDFALRFVRSASTSYANRSSSVCPRSTEEESSDLLYEKLHHSHSSSSTSDRLPADTDADTVGTYASLQEALQLNQKDSPTPHIRQRKPFASNLEMNRIEKPALILPRKLGGPSRSKPKRFFFKRTAFDHSKSSSESTIEHSIRIPNDDENSEDSRTNPFEEFFDGRFNNNHFQTFCRVLPTQNRNKLEEKVPVGPNRFTDWSDSTFEIPKCLSPSSSTRFNRSITELNTIISFYSGEETVVLPTDNDSSAVDLENVDTPDYQEEREIAHKGIQTGRENGENIRESKEKIREGCIKKQVNSIFRRMYKPFKAKHFERKNKVTQ
ncbi:hypothetical protein J6590_040864 [Homalodisca vitripennis]|nr:hypothetical protein J6590_040864 [Homalodisca vitripennis]